MKPPPFDYHDPDSVDEVLALLDEYGDDAKVLAGGQSLIPLLSFRLARPEVLIDINRIAALSYVERDDHGPWLRIGALTRQATAERSAQVATAAPLLGKALQFVAHPQIRNRGTIGGSVAHADPAAELPVTMVALDAVMVARGPEGVRHIPAEELFISHLTTSLDDRELLTEIRIPAASAGTQVAFKEFTRRHGDYALGGAAVTITSDRSAVCTDARIVLLAAGDVPVRARDSEAMLVGRSVDAALAATAAALATERIEPISNIHGDTAYRRSVIQSECASAITEAAGQTGGPVR